MERPPSSENQLQPSPADLRVLFISAEADPFVRVGGLGDVGGSLPQALRSLQTQGDQEPGLDIRLVIPFYGVIDPTAFDIILLKVFTVPYKQGTIQVRAFATQVNGLPVYLISGDPFLRDAPVYSLDARLDGTKFAFFSLAALELCCQIDWKPDILHANDWHTAIAVHALKFFREKDTFYSGTKSILTIHNLPYMGNGAEGAIADFHLPYSENPRLPDWARKLPLPLGLDAADYLVAVSPTYAQEILTPEFGSGLQDYFRNRISSLSGILNGIDTVLWDPSTDASPLAHFSAENIAPRVLNKRAIQSRFSMLEDDRTPLLLSIGRMDPQKGVDLTLAALRRATGLDWQVIFLGTGNPELEAEARQFEIDFPDRVRAVIRFDNRLAHQLYAAADMILMPSRYEPCGLAQMIAMRYGCVPIARATGGLVDTIKDYSQPDQATGFLFQDPKPEALYESLNQALNVFPDRPAWSALQQRGMHQDFSWIRSANAYADLYRSLKG